MIRKTTIRNNITALILAIACLFALAGCGGKTTQIVPELTQNAYTGAPVVECNGVYFNNFGHERLVPAYGKDAFFAYTDGVTAIVTYYGDETDVTTLDVTIFDLSRSAETGGTLRTDAPTTLNFDGMGNGGYVVCIDGLYGKAAIYLYLQDGTLWVADGYCDRYFAQTTSDWLQELQVFVADSGYTPEDCISVTDKDFAYPIIDNLILYNRCDNDLWRATAHEIVPDAEGLTKAEGAIRLADWMGRNIAFDRYVTEVLEMSRASYNDDFSGKYSVWNIRCGKCVDFATIYCIMCREMGIPCDSLADDTHVWNILWLDGRWVEYDTSSAVQAYVTGPDPVADRTTENVTWSPLSIIRHTEDFTDIKVHSGMLTYKYVTTGED